MPAFRSLLPLTLLLLLLAGCGSTRFFVLSTPSTPTHHYPSTKRVIGIEQVTVPRYLFKREIAVAESASSVLFLSGATWAEDLQEGLTHRLIAFLQTKFNHPDVYAYPWELSRQPDIKLKLQISRFIAQDDRVTLQAVWELENLHTTKRTAKLFHITLPTTPNDIEKIVHSMDQAFGALEEDIAKGVKRF